MVSSPQFDVGANNVVTGMKAVANNADCATMVPWYLLVFRPVQMVVGHLIAFHKKDLDELADELWSTLRVAVADDQGTGHVFAKHGKRIAFRNIDNPVLYRSKTWAAMVNQKERHAICQQAGVGSRLAYFAYIFTYAQIPATLWLLTHLAQPSAWALFATPMLTRALLALYVEKLFLHSTKMTRKYFWTIPLWDLAAAYFVVKAVATQRIDYHGKWYTLVDRYHIKPESVPQRPESRTATGS
jgi:hypothetical protein